MVFLSPSSTESAFIFSTDDGSDAYVLDIKGVYALVDGGGEPLGFTHCLRTPSAAIVSSAAPAGLTNAREMNKQPDSLVAVIGNLPSAAALKDAAAAEPLRELYKTLSLPPVVAQLKGAKPEPLVIHKGLSSGTLSVYTLAGDAKDAEAVAKAYQSGSAESIETAAAAASSVLLIVWQPAREDAPIKRILHLGSAPLPRIQQALDRARALPFLQSATASAASLKAKPAAAARPAAAAAPAARPAARAAPAAAPAAAKPAARAPPAARAAPAARPPGSMRAPPTSIAAVPKSSSARASMPARPAAATASGPAASSAARPARASTATSSRPAAAAAPAARAAARPNAGAGKEEVAKKTIVSKSAAAPSSARASPSGAASRTPVKGAAAPSSARASPAAAGAATAAGAAVAAVAATTVVAAAAASSDPTPPVQHHEEETEPAAAAAAPAAHPSISVSIDDMDDGDVLHQTPGGLPVPASPTIIPATPQPPMSPEPMDEDHHQEEHVPSSPEPSEVSAVDVDDKWLQQHDEQPAAPAADAAEEPKKEEPAVVPSAPLEPEPTVPSAPSILEPAASVDEPECVKELVEEEPQPDHKPALPTPGSDDVHEEDQGSKKEEEEKEADEDPYKPAPEPAAPAADEEPEPEPTQPAAPAPTPVDPATGGGEVGDLLGDFGGDQPVQPQQPGDDGLLDSLEEPMKKMQISMDTDKLAEELGLVGDEEQKKAEGECSLLDLTQESTMDTDLEKTQNSSVVESAHEYDDGHLSPVGGGAAGDLLTEMQRKLSQQAEESLLTAAADPFIAGLASTVVEAATIDGAKSTLESLISNNRGVESPTGDKLLSFRSSGYENPDEPKEVKYEETDPAIDDVLTKLADESDMVNGAPRNVELNGHGDSTPSATANNGHLSHSSALHGGVEVHGNGWPEGTTMHLPAPTTTKGAAAGKFKLAGPVHVDMVTVPHRGKQILLTDEAASLEFFSSVRSSIYLLQTGGDVPVHVLDGWKRGKGAWAANVPSRLIPTHHNEVVSRWAADNQEELAEIGLTVATPVDLTTLTYPDGQAKACTVVL